MKLSDFIKKMPSGSPGAEILKIALLIAGTVFVDRISDIVKESISTITVLLSSTAEEESAKQLLSRSLSKTKKHYISLPTWNPKGRI